MASLQEIRARIAQQENKSGNKGSNTQSDNAIYPHWNIDEGTVATVRFLPDANDKNTFFWVERQLIRLPFNGVKGDPNVKRIEVSVPCTEMYNDGSTCPILAEVRPWYKDESLKEMANKYWKKRSYIFQGFVRQNPLGDDKTPANSIRKFIISSQIFNVIKSSLMDPEMEELPTDYMRGLDFNIKKTSKGGYADYSTSSWARKETALTEDERLAIEAHGLFNLSDFLPKKPSETELKIIKEMFDASVDGKAYDIERWGAYYKPYGLDVPASSVASNNVIEKTASVSSTLNTEEEETSSTESTILSNEKAKVSTDKAMDIIQMIRNRQNKSA